MSKKKTTPWFEGDVKPVREGVYQRQYQQETIFNRWDGEKWIYAARTIEDACREVARSLCQDLPWRGLANPPKGSA